MWWLPLALGAPVELPSIDRPLKTGASAPEDAALVIGVEDYYELPDVPYAGSDAQTFRDFLVYTRGLKPSRVELLNETRNTSAAMLRVAAKRLGDSVGPGGTAWIYFAGHGAASPETSERLLMGVTTSPMIEVFTDGTVPVAEIEALAGSGGGKVFLVLDTCYAGAGVADLKRFAVPSYAVEASEQRGTWTAAGPNELSGPLESVEHGAFTYFAIGALRGWADGVLDEPDGQVTAEEAQEYVYQALRAAQINDQKPVLAASDPEDWVLSKGQLETGPDLAAVDSVVTEPAPTPAPSPTATPTPASRRRAPGFVLPSARDAAAKLGPSQWTGNLAADPKPLILAFVEPGCAACPDMLTAMQQIHGTRDDVRVAAVVHGSQSEGASLTADLALDYPVMVDPFRVVTRKYDVQSFPTLVHLDEEHRLAERKDSAGLDDFLALLPEAPGLTRADASRVFRRHVSSFQSCYQQALRSNPMLQGKVELSITVDPQGTVTGASISSSSLNNATAESCMVKKAKTLVFPSFNGPPAALKYPLVFTAQ